MPENTDNTPKVLINNEVVPISETKTTFSFKAPTPKWATNIFNSWIAISGVTALILVTFPEYIPAAVDDIASRILIIGTPVLRIVTKAFGVEVKEKPEEE